MRFPLTEQLVDEARTFNLRSACPHCFFELADGRCGLAWPNDDQRRWPLDADLADGTRPTVVDFCKEFELR